MKRKNLITLFTFLFITAFHNIRATDSLVIQENTLGVCTMDGIIEDSQEGYTGEGYVNVDNGLNIGMSWSFNADSAGTYKIQWRYALGGTDTLSRNAALYVNNFIVDTVIFKHSGSTSWAEWKLTKLKSINIIEGNNSIRLTSITLKGLANLDYFVLFGEGFSMSECVPTYTLSVLPNNLKFGSVSYSPIQDLYEIGTEITVESQPNAGYFFHSWSGEESSTLQTFKFSIKENTNLTALFYKEGSQLAEGANGYASIQHDNGTPYLLTGGNLGQTVEPNTTEELQAYLSSTDTLVVQISKHFVGAGEIGIKSNKTLIGTNDSAHIEGIMNAISNCRNIIIKNITFSKVITWDEMEINGAKNIWIDHCEFFTDRDHDKDYYDGLLDIKNESSFITVSWCNFHDHAKCILISSGDDSYQDSVQRITFHHNYFHNCGSRLPSIRFGKSHIFSNYYENNSGAINTRVGACVKVEHNYFKNSGTAIIKTETAYLDMEPNTNIFEGCSYSKDILPCNLEVPYTYDSLIDSASILPTLIPENVRVFKSAGSPSGINFSHVNIADIKCFPNPSKDNLSVSFYLLQKSKVSIDLFNTLGNNPKQFINKQNMDAGQHEFEFNLDHFLSGIYILRFTVEDYQINKLIIIK